MTARPPAVAWRPAFSKRVRRGHAPGVIMKSIELLVERIILASRWILVAFYLGLVAALAVYAVAFISKFLKIAQNVFVLG